MSQLSTYLTLLIGSNIPTPVSDIIINAIEAIEITNSDEGRDGFQITFTVGKNKEFTNNDYLLLNNDLLKPFNRVIMIINFGLVPKILIDGIITHQQFNPSIEPGQSSFTVTGEDLSVIMDMDEKSTTHPNQSAMDIVFNLINSYEDLGLIPDIKIPQSMEKPTVTQKLYTQQGTDLEYILKLSSLHDFVFFVEPTDLVSTNRAYWGPLQLIGNIQKPLSYNMGSESNITSINFQYNSLKSNTISGNIYVPYIGIKIPINISSSLRPTLSAKPAFTTQSKVRSKQFRDSGMSPIQALVKAQSEVNKSSDVVSVSGEIDVSRYRDILRARHRVWLRGVGNTHDGIYYVKNVTHRIRVGEYNQSFTLTREGLESTTDIIS